MSMHDGLPVAGYRPQSTEAVDTVNTNKQLEEQCLRQLDSLAGKVDPRWLAIGRTHMELAWMAINRAVFQLELAWMAINRAVFQPSRVKMPGDVE